MPAEVAINRLTGSGPTYTRIDSGGYGATRASTSDSPSPGVSNPIPLPTTATPTLGYWVVLQLETLTAPVGTINNIQWFTNGFLIWPGVDLVVGQATAYTQATGVVGVSGTELNQTNYPTLVNPPIAATAFTSSNPYPITGSTSTNEKFGNFIVTQMQVSTSAVAGVLPDENFFIVWDET